MPKRGFKLKAGLAIAMAMILTALAAPGGASAACRTGGLTPAEVDICTPTANAKLLASGELIPPASAPAQVKAVIAAADNTRTRPYIYGGGHASFIFHRLRLLRLGLLRPPRRQVPRKPPPLRPARGAGAKKARGRWITVYANSGHAYMTVAGYRFDTAGDEGIDETGPRWHEVLPSNEGYVARHPLGF